MPTDAGQRTSAALGGAPKRRQTWRRCWVTTAWWTVLWLAGTLAADRSAMGIAWGSDLVDDVERVRSGFRQELQALAQWCDEHDLPAAAKTTRRHGELSLPDRMLLVDLPSQVGPPPLAAEASDDERTWHERYWTLRQQHAAELFPLARRAVQIKQWSQGVELLLLTAWEDPDHELARKLLGFQKYRDAWRTPYEAQKLQRGFLWHERFGWLPKAHHARYDAGERYVDGRWLKAEDEAKKRTDITRGWQIETEHYRVTTDHSLEEGVRLGVELENLFRAWRQVFLRYFASEADLASMFEGRAARQRTARRHEVVFFRNEAEYRAALRGAIPDDVPTLGIYMGDQKTAYFFAAAGDDEEHRTTLYHEATHQLFSESRPVAAVIGARANFWIIEGIACYMESLQRTEDAWTVGGHDAERFQAARHRLLVDKFYVPLEELCRWGMADLQSDPRIATVYSEATGLTQFLMHYEHGRYRDALLRYLEAIYTGRDRPSTLAEVTGQAFEDLDQQYKAYVRATEAITAATDGAN